MTQDLMLDKNGPMDGDPLALQKISEINDMNWVINSRAGFFKTHFIKYNDNKDETLTKEISVMISNLAENGHMYIAKNSS